MRQVLHDFSHLLLLAILVFSIGGCSKPIKTEAVPTTYAKILYNPAHNQILGNPQGAITLVEFFDYNCGQCRASAAVISKLAKQNHDLRIVFKDINLFKSQSSLLAATAALAADAQHKYLEMHQALMQYNHGNLSSKAIDQIAQQIGLNLTLLHRDMQRPQYYEQVEKNTKLADALNIPGTPAFFIGPTTLATANNIEKARQVQIIGKATTAYFELIINKIRHSNA